MDAGPDDQEAVETAASNLERLNPTPSPLASELLKSLHALLGVWSGGDKGNTTLSLLASACLDAWMPCWDVKW